MITGDMRLYLTEDLGTFDVVTAFCSLYYLDESDMTRIIRKAAESCATLILQSNDAIENLPAQTARLHRLLTDNGYPTVRVFAFPGFARPLLVASTENSAGAGGTRQSSNARLASSICACSRSATTSPSNGFGVGCSNLGHFNVATILRSRRNA